MVLSLMRAALAVLLLSPVALAQSGERLAAPEVAMEAEAVARVVPIGDLTRRADADAARDELLELARTGATPDLTALREQLESAVARADRVADDLCAMVRIYGQPAFEASLGTHVDRIVGGDDLLIVIGTPSQQAWVDEFLELQRVEDVLYDVQAHILSVPEGALEALSPRDMDTTGGTTLLDEATADALLADLSAAGGEVVTAPRLLTFARQRGSLSVAREHAFVLDYELRTVQPGDRVVADPIIDVVQEGVFLDVQGVPLPGGVIGLDLKLTHADVEEPIETMDAREQLGMESYAEPLELALPSVRSVSVETQIELVSGSTAVLSSSGLEPGRELAVMVRVQRVAPEEAAAINGGR